MAGFDRVDPAYSCLLFVAVQVCTPAHPRMMTNWAFNPIEKRQRASWTRKFQWPESTPCTGDPEW
jgi:hypothetical protein